MGFFNSLINRSSICLFVLTLVWLGSSSAFSAEGKGWQAEWDKTVQAAKKEGQVTVYVSSRGVTHPSDAFQKKYPEIKYLSVVSPTAMIAQRTMSERRARKYIVDVILAGANPNYQVFYRNGVLDPIRPALILPENVDKSHWVRGKQFYIDPEGKYVFVFFGNVARVGSYNTKLVDPAEFKSYRDFLKPKWKGKILARDIRRPGSGGDAMRFFYASAELGPDFIGQFFGETGITLTGNNRQGVDWLSRGRFPVGLFLGRVAQAKAQGLPVDEFDPHNFKEGAPLGISGGSVVLVKNAPHPNAAKVFINFLLSREGQKAMQKKMVRLGAGADSMRLDISKDYVPRIVRRRKGAKYTFTATPKLTNMLPIYKVVNKALARAKKK